VPDACLQKKTSVNRGVKRLIRVDIGLIAASIAVLAVGFALTYAIGLATTGPQAKPTGIGASFDERFASAFGSPGNAAGKAAETVEPANDMLLQQRDFGEHAKPNPPAPRSASELAPVTTSRLASVREERLNTTAASMGLSLPFDADSHTAIYDIAARTVYLPNGYRLEAHSGLRSHLDDPRYVNTKGQGPTPPNVYNLALRERLFHGVRAIRLIPVDDHKMFGRDGMLAHSYMLGPSGQSNGCVSFRNYPAFLNAFLKGEVDRLVVVEDLATATGAKTSAPSGG